MGDLDLVANSVPVDFLFPVTLQFGGANIPASATTDLTLAQGGTGWVVPAGYVAYAVALCIVGNAAVTAQTLTAKCIDDGTELTNGPAPVLTTSVQRATDTLYAGAQPIAAGSVVGVSVTTPAGFTPTTIDVDAILTLVLAPQAVGG